MTARFDYEWDIETVDAKTGDILDHNHRDRLAKFAQKPKTNEALVLVRTDNDPDASEYRLWAYVTDGKLPVFFADASERATAVKVPAKFHHEFAKWAA